MSRNARHIIGFFFLALYYLIDISTVAWKAQAFKPSGGGKSTGMRMEVGCCPLSSMHRSIRCGDDTITLKLVYKGGEKQQQSRKLPIVLFLGGADCPHESYAWLANRLAQDGYCVVLSSCVVSLGGTQTAMLLPVPYNMTMLSSLELYKKNPCSQGIHDILKELSLIDSTEGNPLHQRLDTDCLVVGGHSTGGRIVLDLVSFDNTFPIKAAFTYGASLVISNSMSSFAENGSVQQCDATSPPPLLLMGGSQDGVSAAISETNEPTETLKRTVKEALEAANGDVDFLVFKGCNHMAFCSPIDPTCSAVQRDLPLTVEEKFLKKDTLQHILGDVISDFCSVHTQSDSGEPRAFEPRIPIKLYHTARSIRHSTKPELVLLLDREKERDALLAWEKLSSKMDGWTDTLKSKLKLQPTDKPIPETWSHNNLTGSLRAWESEKVVWSVRYENSMTNSSNSLGLNVWLSDKTDAPHLTIHIGVRGGKATIMGDLVPRYDLAKEGFDAYKSFDKKWTKCIREGKLAGLVPFASSDASVRAIQSPYSIAFVLDDLACNQGLESLLDLLDLYFSSWLEMATNFGPVLSDTVLERDNAIRQILLKHERAAGERFMDQQMAETLANTMAGYF